MHISKVFFNQQVLISLFWKYSHKDKDNQDPSLQIGWYAKKPNKMTQLSASNTQMHPKPPQRKQIAVGHNTKHSHPSELSYWAQWKPSSSALSISPIAFLAEPLHLLCKIRLFACNFEIKMNFQQAAEYPNEQNWTPVNGFHWSDVTNLRMEAHRDISKCYPSLGWCSSTAQLQSPPFPVWMSSTAGGATAAELLCVFETHCYVPCISTQRSIKHDVGLGRLLIRDET